MTTNLSTLFPLLGDKSMILINTTTVGTAVSSIDFTSGLDASYVKYFIEFSGAQMSSTSTFLLRVRRASDNVWITPSVGASLRGTTSGSATASSSGDEICPGGSGSSYGVVAIFCPGLSYQKSESIGYGSSGTGLICISAASTGGTTINGFRITTYGPTISAGTFRLYGVKA